MTGLSRPAPVAPGPQPSRETSIKGLFAKERSRLISSAAIAVPMALVAAGTDADLNLPALLALAAAYAILLPKLVLATIRLENRVNLKLAMVTPGRLVWTAANAGVVLLTMLLLGLQVPMLTAALICSASCAVQAGGVTLAYLGFGDRERNTLSALAIATTLITTAIILDIARPAALPLSLLFVGFLAHGLASDARARRYPAFGIGVFFGTFNPVHVKHLEILRRALQTRGLSKIYVHSTTVPALHRNALERGELSMSLRSGMRVYEKTALADSTKNYFPTGNKFFEYELRRELLHAGINDADLEGRVMILHLPEIYEKGGFLGILRFIAKHEPPGTPIHGIHGSDTGGMWVRNIFDFHGGVYPMSIVRSDSISATAIREGAVGYTSPTVERFLQAARNGQDFVFPSGFVFRSEVPSGRTPSDDEHTGGRLDETCILVDQSNQVPQLASVVGTEERRGPRNESFEV